MEIPYSWKTSLDKLREHFELAQEEYEQELNALEDEFGFEVREAYEESHLK